MFTFTSVFNTATTYKFQTEQEAVKAAYTYALANFTATDVFDPTGGFVVRVKPNGYLIYADAPCRTVWQDLL